MYADEPLGLDVNIAGKVYALDSSTIENLLLPRLLGLTVLVGTQKLDLLARSVLYSLFFFLQLVLELELTPIATHRLSRYRVYPSHSPELERPLHSRVSRLSRSPVLSAEPL